MKISVIIPTYSPGEYLWECLDSLCEQSFLKRNFEILLILNGTKEPYYSSIIEYIKKHTDTSITLYYTQIAGVSNARNMGLNVARGEYIVFVDDDDIVSLNYLEELSKRADPFSIVVSNVMTFTETINNIGNDYITQIFYRLKNSSTNSLFKKRGFLSSSCCKLIPRTIIDSHRFNLRYSLGEDALFMASLSDKIKYIVLSSEDTIYYRRLRKNSASRRGLSFCENINNTFFLIFSYLKMYLSSPFEYNILFFSSRIVAVLRHLLVRCLFF